MIALLIGAALFVLFLVQHDGYELGLAVIFLLFGCVGGQLKSATFLGNKMEWWDREQVQQEAKRLPEKERQTAGEVAQTGAKGPPADESRKGIHARFFSESSFLRLQRGLTGQFAIGYWNVGTESWQKGVPGHEVSIATNSPLNNTHDYDNGWAVGWPAPDRYARQANDLVAPGQVGFFIFNFQVPEEVPIGTHRFNIRPVVDGVGPLEDEGAHLDVEIAPGRPQIRSAVGPVLPGFVRYQGRVRSASTHEPIAGVCVYAGPPVGCPQVPLLTDGHGAWAIDFPAGSSWMFNFEHQGFERVVQCPADDAHSSIDIEMTELPQVVGLSLPAAERIVLQCNMPMNPSQENGGARNPANYLLDGIPSSPAFDPMIAVGPDGRSVRLTLLRPLHGVHTLHVRGLRNLQGQLIAPDPTTFTVTFT